MSVKELQQILKNPDYLAVDIRENEVYSGWTISASEKGGHIPGVWDKFTLYDDISKNRVRGAFRRFKEDIRKTGMEQEWYDYRDKAYRNAAIEWCDENGFNYE